jgi:hypothetical protein
MYAGSQAMRWLVTREPQAMEEFKRALKGVLLLLDVTGDPKEFARTAELKDGTQLAGFWRQAVPPYQNVRYAAGGNNDMIKGIFHAMAWAFVILDNSDPVMKEVREHAPRLLRLNVTDGVKNARNRFHAKMLTALAAGDTSWRSAYMRTYTFSVKPRTDLSIDIGFYHGGIADWSGINLGMVGTVTEVLLLKKLIEVTPEPDFEKEALRSVRQNLVEMWATYESARREQITLAALVFGASDVFLQIPDTAPKEWPSQAIWETSVDKTVWGLREVPLIRIHHEAKYDYRLRPDWCPSAWPLRPWKMFTQNNQTLHYMQGAYSYPLFEGAALFTDSLWGSAFIYHGGSSPGVRDGRHDYLHAYWMMRLSGRFNDPNL